MFPASLVTFTEETLDGKIHFSCSVNYRDTLLRISILYGFFWKKFPRMIPSELGFVELSNWFNKNWFNSVGKFLLVL